MTNPVKGGETMQTLAILDMDARAVDAIMPAQTKSNGNGDQFDRVLKKTEQPGSHQSASKPVAKKSEPKPRTEEHSATNAAQASNDSKDAKVENQLAEVEAKQGAAEVTEVGAAETEVAAQLQMPEQQALVDWLKTMIPVETMENTEASAEIETELFALVAQLNPEELQRLELNRGDEKSLGQLLQQIDPAVDLGPELAAKIELLVSQLAELTSQQGSSITTEDLVSTPQLLQQVVAAVGALKGDAVGPNRGEAGKVDVINGQSTAHDVVSEETHAVLTAAEKSVAVAGDTEEVDPRFSGLLQPRNVQAQTVKANANPVKTDVQGQAVTQDLTAEVVELAPELKPEQSSSTNLKQMAESLIKQAPNNLQGQSAANAPVDMNRTMPQTQVVQLPSGQQVSESQIFDQVVTQLSGSVNGESGKMVLRLQPAELGSLKLELTIEGDKVRANLHAQTQQVQEVLERNLPQLKSALAEQGLKVDQFNVNVDKGSDQQSQFENLAQQQQDGSQQRNGWQADDVEAEELSIPLAHLIQNGGGGISLHV